MKCNCRKSGTSGVCFCFAPPHGDDVVRMWGEEWHVIEGPAWDLPKGTYRDDGWFIKDEPPSTTETTSLPVDAIGWICPRCQRVHAPSVKGCACPMGYEQ